jgi:hypothetical protein
MKKLLGTYFLGYESIRVFTDAKSRDGEAQLPGKWQNAGTVLLAEITIGLNLSWQETVETMLHEAFEYAAIKQNCRFVGSAWANSSPSRGLFVLDHEQFSEICAQVGVFTAEVLPELAGVWKALHK